MVAIIVLACCVQFGFGRRDLSETHEKTAIPSDQNVKNLKNWHGTAHASGWHTNNDSSVRHRAGDTNMTKQNTTQSSIDRLPLTSQFAAVIQNLTGGFRSGIDHHSQVKTQLSRINSAIHAAVEDASRGAPEVSFEDSAGEASFMLSAESLSTPPIEISPVWRHVGTLLVSLGIATAFIGFVTMAMLAIGKCTKCDLSYSSSSDSPYNMRGRIKMPILEDCILVEDDLYPEAENSSDSSDHLQPVPVASEFY